MRTMIAALVQKKIAGEVLGLVASKTQWGVTAAAGGGIWAILPGVFEKDPEAIGQLVLIGVGWVVALIGRLKAKIKE